MASKVTTPRASEERLICFLLLHRQSPLKNGVFSLTLEETNREPRRTRSITKEKHGQSVRLGAAGRRRNSVHAQILHHLAVMIEGVRDTKRRQAQAGRFAALRSLQHVLQRQCGRGLVTECKRFLQEGDDVGFGLYVCGTVPVL